MPALKLCANKWHQYWDYGGIYGPIEYGVDWFDCYCGLANGNDDGENEGLNLTYPVRIACGSSAWFQCVGGRGGDVADLIKIYFNGSVAWTSDCAATDFDSGVISVPSTTTSITVEVIADCAFTSAYTYWYISWALRC
jgi:hypothetical protein